ncbi:MAG: hypothetical protein NTX36_14385 [Proteobacteria bacterium]|nr:hypothetical protein [Pseudomonadota bacterium]
MSSADIKNTVQQLSDFVCGKKEVFNRPLRSTRADKRLCLFAPPTLARQILSAPDGAKYIYLQGCGFVILFILHCPAFGRIKTYTFYK